MIQCNGQPCYNQSSKSYSVCKPAYVDNPVSSDDVLHYFPFQLKCVFVLWFLLVSLNLLELTLQKAHRDRTDVNLALIQSTGRNKNISLLFALLGFTIPIMFLYQKNFRKDSFCLMNRQEAICQRNWKDLSPDLDCFELAAKPNSSIEAFNNMFTAVIKSGWFWSVIELMSHIYDCAR